MVSQLVEDLYWEVDKKVLRRNPKVGFYRELGAAFRKKAEAEMIPEFREKLSEDNKTYFDSRMEDYQSRAYFDVMSHLSLIDLEIMGKEVIQNKQAERAAFKTGLDFLTLKLADVTDDRKTFWDEWSAARKGNSPEVSSKSIEVVCNIYENALSKKDYEDVENIVDTMREARKHYEIADTDRRKFEFGKEYGNASGKLMHRDLETEYDLPSWSVQFLSMQGGAAKIVDDWKDFFRDRENGKGYRDPLMWPKLLWRGWRESRKTVRESLPEGKRENYDAFMTQVKLFHVREWLEIKPRS